jgi:acetyl-CoA carboxylase biotin carboxyl carrier protein
VLQSEDIAGGGTASPDGVVRDDSLDAIETLLAVLRDAPHLTEVELRRGDRTLLVRRNPPAEKKATPAKKAASANDAGRSAAPGSGADAKAGGVAEAAAPRNDGAHAVTAQLVGIFRAVRPTPVVVGDTVRENQAVGQIEAMRLMNDCPAPVAGRVVAVLVQDGQPVEYGQTLVEIVPEPIGEAAS